MEYAEISKGSVIVMNLVNVNKSIISQNSEQFFCI